MTCKCGSSRIIHFSCKSSDRNSIDYEDQTHDGYVPYDLGIGGGDYVEFAYCADCGTIQSPVFPLREIILQDD